MAEVVFFHRASRTAISGDMIQCFPEASISGWKGMVMRLGDSAAWWVSMAPHHATGAPAFCGAVPSVPHDRRCWHGTLSDC